jgi:hypothetical protein
MGGEVEMMDVGGGHLERVKNLKIMVILNIVRDNCKTSLGVCMQSNECFLS